MNAAVLCLPGAERLAERLRKRLDAEPASLAIHRFPDSERCVRITGDVAGRAVVLVAALDRPDEKLLPLLFAAATARDLGATTVGLVAPYLPYLRQDRRFHPGEG
jgi:ribose-phosphate pyrophosphokinase